MYSLYIRFIYSQVTSNYVSVCVYLCVCLVYSANIYYNIQYARKVVNFPFFIFHFFITLRLHLCSCVCVCVCVYVWVLLLYYIIVIIMLFSLRIIFIINSLNLPALILVLFSSSFFTIYIYNFICYIFNFA